MKGHVQRTWHSHLLAMIEARRLARVTGRRQRVVRWDGVDLHGAYRWVIVDGMAEPCS